MKRIALAIGILLSVSSARADWLSDVWPPDHAPAHGDPAITFNAAGGVIAVLPEQVLADAAKAGLAPEGAVAAFLGRYAPRMCSTLWDAAVPHKSLSVTLYVQREFFDGQTTYHLVDDVAVPLTVDYIPSVAVHCISPDDLVS